MFQVTERAAQQLKSALAKVEDAPGACFRIGIAESKVQLALDQERSGDTTIEYEGETLVVFDATTKDVLGDRELDFDAEAPGLVLKEAG